MSEHTPRRWQLHRPVRYLIVALCFGPVCSLAIVAGERALGALPYLLGDGDDLIEATTQQIVWFTPACVAVAWIFRRPIVRSRGWATLGTALVCAVLGAPAYIAAHLLHDYATNAHDLGWSTILDFTVETLLSGTPFGIAFLPVSLPLTYVAIFVLRRAAGSASDAVGPASAVVAEPR